MDSDFRLWPSDHSRKGQAMVQAQTVGPVRLASRRIGGSAARWGGAAQLLRRSRKQFNAVGEFAERQRPCVALESFVE